MLQNHSLIFDCCIVYTTGNVSWSHGQRHSLKNFDGKIFLQRVSKEKDLAQTTCNQNFSDDASANGLLKHGKWKDENLGLVVNDMTLGDLKDALANQYQIDKNIYERIIIQTAHVGKLRKCKHVGNDVALIPTEDVLTIGDYTLRF